MSSDTSLAPYLAALQEMDRDDLVVEERQRRRDQRQSRIEADIESMDVDDQGALSSTNAIDLEDIVFSQGSHFMANKRCQLPEGSFRKQRRGMLDCFVQGIYKVLKSLKMS